MKRLKVISLLLTVAMCMSLITTPVSVLAEDSAAPSETETVETTEKAESSETTAKEPKPTEQKPSENTKESEQTHAEGEPAESSTKEAVPSETTESDSLNEQNATDKHEQETSNKTETTDKQEPTSETNSSDDEVPEESVPTIVPDQRIKKIPRKTSETPVSEKFYFGRYIQSLITDQEELDIVKKAEFTNGEATVQNIKIKFRDGKYYKEEPIEWRLIADDGQNYVLISENVLDKHLFSNGDAFWSKSLIRTWLNSDFLNNAFSKHEQEDIVSTQVTNVESDLKDNMPSESYTVTTTDKVYLFSKDEFEGGIYGFNVESTGYTLSTDWASNETSKLVNYWLRGPACWKDGIRRYAYYVSPINSYPGPRGIINYFYTKFNYGVRPVIRVKKGSKNLLTSKPDVQLKTKITLSNESITLAIGKSCIITGTGFSDITYKSSNKMVAKVSANGTIKALKVGNATITAYSKSDPSKTATCKVSVRYRINYVLNGGTNSSDNPEWYANNRVYLKKPTRTGYVFKMWYKKSKGKQKKVGSVKNENITLYAKWEPITYKIKYKGNFLFAGSQKDQTCKYNACYKIASCSIKRSGYRFLFWTTNPDGSGTAYLNGYPISNLTTKNNDVINLYAQWEIEVYDIKYDIPADVINNNPNTYTKFDETIKLKSPSREGYDFLYWYTKGTKKVYNKKKKKYKTVDTENKISAINSGSTGNKTIYAKWKAHTYRIIFDSNGGTGKMNPMKDCVYGKEFPLTKNTFTAPKDKIFTGWNTKFDGSGTSYANCAKVKNLTAENDGNVTLFAQWKPIFTMRLSLDGFEIYKNKANGILQVDWPNCTVYALGRAYEILEKIGNNIRTRADGNLSFIVPGHSSAKYWLENNASSGNPYPTGGPEEPRVGAIAVWSSKDNGHVAIVEHIDPDGTVYYSHSVFGGFNPATWAQEPKYYPGSDNNFYFHCEAQYVNGVRKWGYDENGVPDQLLGYIYLI